jgi:hypothetical protein
MAARTLNLLLGLWLFSSAFTFPRTPASMRNALAVGALVAALSVASMLHRVWLRFVNTALSAWLLVAAFLLPQRSALARWNDALIALAMVVLSLVPGSIYPRMTPRHPTPHAL